jgi:hypothetical protein
MQGPKNLNIIILVMIFSVGPLYLAVISSAKITKASLSILFESTFEKVPTVYRGQMGVNWDLLCTNLSAIEMAQSKSSTPGNSFPRAFPAMISFKRVCKKPERYFFPRSEARIV